LTYSLKPSDISKQEKFFNFCVGHFLLYEEAMRRALWTCESEIDKKMRFCQVLLPIHHTPSVIIFRISTKKINNKFQTRTLSFLWDRIETTCVKLLRYIPYFSINNSQLIYNAYPKRFRHSFWCIDKARDAN
jgi:hypothetical protein